MSKTKRIKPCDISCIACGSTDILRKYLRKGHTYRIYDNIDNQKDRNNEFIEVKYDFMKTKKECIIHCCRCCDYEWESYPWIADIKITKVKSG